MAMPGPNAAAPPAGPAPSAGPPADIDGCIKLSAETARGAKIQSEAEYIKFHSKLLDLDAACGARDFVGAEKIAADIRAALQTVCRFGARAVRRPR